MRCLSAVVVAAMATLAFSTVAAAQDGAQTFTCAEFFGPGVTGQVVYTPSGKFNANCTAPGPPFEAGGGASTFQCSEFSEFLGPDVTGNIVITPSGHYKFHCKFPEV